ncbi:NKG2-A/NKG2-B type II integral membrane protein-like, partial [Mustela erminea]|uniref:NKG2-A/NKG2-B type II integral membrane protein-like n=1 Tax=Mustela erminea TaxID=36723 RepID=UPI00138750C4
MASSTDLMDMDPITDQGVICAELNLQNVSEDLQGNDKNYHCKNKAHSKAQDLLSSLEKLIAGILGTTCLVVTYTVARMISSLPCSGTPQHNNSYPVTRIQKLDPCGHCPKEWITYSNNCYYISTERKSWNESLLSCTPLSYVSKNSTLLYIENEEEMFLNIISYITSWIY